MKSASIDNKDIRRRRWRRLEAQRGVHSSGQRRLGKFQVYGGTIPTPASTSWPVGAFFNNYNVGFSARRRAGVLTGGIGSLGDLHGPFPGRGRPGLPRGNTPSPNYSLTPVMPPHCSASGTGRHARTAAERSRFRRVVGHYEQLGRAGMPHGRCSRRPACRCR